MKTKAKAVKKKEAVTWVLWLRWRNTGWMPYIEATRTTRYSSPTGKGFLMDWVRKSFPSKWEGKARDNYRVLLKGQEPKP